MRDPVCLTVLLLLLLRGLLLHFFSLLLLAAGYTRSYTKKWLQVSWVVVAPALPQHCWLVRTSMPRVRRKYLLLLAACACVSLIGCPSFTLALASDQNETDNNNPGRRQKRKKCYDTLLMKQSRWVRRVVGLNVPLSGERTMAKLCNQQCESTERTEHEEDFDKKVCHKWCDFAFGAQRVDKDTLDRMNAIAFPPLVRGSLRFLMIFRHPVDRFISEFFFCTKTHFGVRECLSGDRPDMMYASHPYFHSIKSRGWPEATKLLEAMTLDEFASIANHPAANRYTRTLGANVYRTSYAGGNGEAQSVEYIDDQLKAFADLFAPNATLDALQQALKHHGLPPSVSGDDRSCREDGAGLCAYNEADVNYAGENLDVRALGELHLQAALAAVECDLYVKRSHCWFLAHRDESGDCFMRA